VGDQRHAPAALPPGKTRYPLYRRLGGPKGQSGRVRKISHSPEFDPSTVQPAASRYTDWDVTARYTDVSSSKYSQIRKAGNEEGQEDEDLVCDTGNNFVFCVTFRPVLGPVQSRINEQGSICL
jgi:hypothetical protein